MGVFYPFSAKLLVKIGKLCLPFKSLEIIYGPVHSLDLNTAS